MVIVGLTGGIASGKTLVSDTFKSLGIPIIDADILARVAVEPGSKGLNALSEHFGARILASHGELDRAALRNLIFGNPDHRKTVDSILHPIIRKLADEQIDIAAKQDHPYAIYAVPLLAETGQQDRFDRIIVVDVSADTQLSRLISRDETTEAKAQAILDAQASRSARLAIADDVIDNSGTIDEVRTQVTQLHARYQLLFQ